MESRRVVLGALATAALLVAARAMDRCLTGRARLSERGLSVQRESAGWERTC